jgi:hypothetical protein
VVFAIAWNSFLVYWFRLGFANFHSMPWLFFVFPIGHVFVGARMTYGVFKTMFNRTIFSVDGDVVGVRTTPLGWRSPRVVIDRRRITQIAVTNRTVKTEDGSDVNHGLMARLDDGTQLELIDTIDNLEQARFIERAIEAHLAVVDDGQDLDLTA